MPRLPRAIWGQARAECTWTVACGAPEPKTVSRPSSITVSWPTRMRLSSAMTSLRATRAVIGRGGAGRGRP